MEEEGRKPEGEEGVGDIGEAFLAGPGAEGGEHFAEHFEEKH